MSYTTNVKVHAIRRDGSIGVINYNFTNEKAAYSFYLKAKRHPHVDDVEFPGIHLMTFTRSDQALANLESYTA